MKIAVAGKGGSGKTTIAATLARLIARRGRAVVAIDGDSNPNLGTALGLPRERAESLPTVPSDVLEQRVRDDGTKYSALAIPIDQVASRYGVIAPDAVKLLVMARVAHAGAG